MAVGMYTAWLLLAFASLVAPFFFDEEEKTSYHLYTKSNRDSMEPPEIELDKDLPSMFLRGQKTVFIIHGFKSEWNRPSFLKMKNAFVNKEDRNKVNVVLVDWPSRTWNPLNYWEIADDTVEVGEKTAEVMKKLVDEGGVSYDDIWCVGHSLGAHVCGFAGRNTPQKIGRITGLDPAGPAFESEDISEGLNANNAQFVDIIHTDTHRRTVLAYGTRRALGDMDFYVNGLGEQPDCFERRKRKDLGDAISCSHSRATEYFTESIENEDCFVASAKCADVDDLEDPATRCEPCENAIGGCPEMGYGAEKTRADGIYNVIPSDKESHYCSPR